jgi:precorrin-2/cobalt-factor-2 C20-methyltransferase
MAFQALAARCGIVLTDGRQSLALVTALDGPPDLDAALARPDQAVVVYKGGRHLPALAEALAAAGRLDGAVVGELLGWPGERVGLVKELVDGPASYLATVVVPPECGDARPFSRTGGARNRHGASGTASSAPPPPEDSKHRAGGQR